MKTIAFIGVGIMGQGIVQNLKKTDCRLRLYSRSPKKIENLADTKTIICADEKDAIRSADFTILCLTDDHTIENVLWEKGGFDVMKGILIDFGTTSPELTQRMKKECDRRSIIFMDSPMTGSKNAALSAQILFMVGSENEDAYLQSEFIWKATGRKIIRCGKVGQGQAVKIALNMVQAGILQMYLEGMALSEKLGIDFETYREVISESAAKSGISDFKLGTIQNRDFSPHFSLKNMNKDLNHALTIAMEKNLVLPLAFSLKSVYNSGILGNKGEQDFSSLVEIMKEWNKI